MDVLPWQMHDIVLETGNGVKFTISEIDADLAERNWTAYTFRTKYGQYTYVGRRKQPGRKSPKVYIHRIIIERMFPQLLEVLNQSRVVCDHINRDTLDNRRGNLRLVPYSHNRHNSKLDVRNTAGFRGVHWNAARKQWVARLRNRGLDLFLGYFADPKQAALAFDIAVKERKLTTFIQPNFSEEQECQT